MAPLAGVGRNGSLPTLSVVLAFADAEGQEFRAMVASLADLCRHAGAELILSTTSEACAADTRRLTPGCRIVSATQQTTRSLRVDGALAATGDVVLFIDTVASEQVRRVMGRLTARRIGMVGPSRRAEQELPQPELTMISVIMPAHDAARVLPETLRALRASELDADRWELIVVDDASRDNTALIAAHFADVLVRIPFRAHGPAYARNRGFEVSAGTWAVFLDADVKVRGDTLQRFATTFEHEPAAGAIVGSYEVTTPARGVVSQYRNLVHYYAHRESAGDAEAFWAPCGAVRSEVFAQAGMYDEWHYERPMIEGMELGQRIRALGRRILVVPDIQGAHLKAWSLLSAIICDLRDQAVPWMRLLMRQRDLRADRISLGAIERINRVGTWIAVIALLIGSIAGDPRWVMTMGIALLPVIAANRRLYAFFFRERGLFFTLAAIPLHLLYYVVLGVAIIVAGALHLLVGDPRPAPIIEAYAEIGLETWPPVPNRQAVHAFQPSVARG